jgi:hypothetical protein
MGLAAVAALGQSDTYKPYKNNDLWKADTLYLGVGFTRVGTEPVKIWLTGNEAGLEGELSYLDPVSGKTIPLFRNHDAVSTPIILTDKAAVPPGTTLTFMYKVVGKGSWYFDPSPETMLPKYTGPNHAKDKHYSTASSDVNANSALRFGHRWSVAGRVNDSILEFGFEDDTSPTSDMDFDDILFQVQGLKLAVFQKAAKNRNYLW